jgi:hypothetical protein
MSPEKDHRTTRTAAVGEWVDGMMKGWIGSEKESKGNASLDAEKNRKGVPLCELGITGNRVPPLRECKSEKLFSFAWGNRYESSIQG